MTLEYSINYSKSKEITNAILLYKTLKKNLGTMHYRDYLKEQKLEVLDEEEAENIFKDASFVIETPIFRDVFQSGNIKLYYYQNYYYYALKLKEQWHSYKNLEKSDNYVYYILLATLLLILLLVAIHLYIIKALAPLKTLHKKIAMYANPEESYRLNTSKDEVSEVSDAFNKATVRIKSLQDSRTLFWRNVMHEIKTPLTQGMLMVNNLSEEDRQKQNLVDVFKRMETQLDALKELEYINTDVLHLKKAPLNLIDIVDDVKDMLLLDEENIDYRPIANSYLLDPSLFTIVLKNLISNAVQYASDTKVTLCHKNNHLYIINKGEALKESFSHYLEAFTRGDVGKRGMGLGLHITKEILAKHDIPLLYKYLKGHHIIVLKMDTSFWLSTLHTSHHKK